MSKESPNTNGIFDVIGPNLMQALFEEIETNPILACLLDQVEYDPEDNQQQERLEFRICQLLAGDKEIIEQARSILHNPDIPISATSCELLYRHRINPIGAVALACARGKEDENRWAGTLFKIQDGPGKGLWVSLDHISYRGGERIGMHIDLSPQVQWEDTEPHLHFAKDVKFPETLVASMLGQKASRIVETDVLDAYLIKEKIGPQSFLLETQEPMKTIGWMLEQDYQAFDWIEPIRALRDVIIMLRNPHLDIDENIEEIRRLKFLMNRMKAQ